MHIVQSDRFKREINTIAEFISQDSVARAREFQRNFFARLENLKVSPRAHRKSAKFSDENIRELIYKGYVVPYLIDDETILILGIYKENEWEF